MAYIRKMKNKEGRIYVYLVEGYRENGKVKSRILEKYGYLDDLEAQEPGIFERLKKEAKEGKLVDKKILDVSFSLDVPIYAPDKSYGWKILDDIFNTLALDKFFKSHQRNRLKKLRNSREKTKAHKNTSCSLPRCFYSFYTI